MSSDTNEEIPKKKKVERSFLYYNVNTSLKYLYLKYQNTRAAQNIESL